MFIYILAFSILHSHHSILFFFLQFFFYSFLRRRDVPNVRGRAFCGRDQGILVLHFFFLIQQYRLSAPPNQMANTLMPSTRFTRPLLCIRNPGSRARVSVVCVMPTEEEIIEIFCMICFAVYNLLLLLLPMDRVARLRWR